jgi:hypothetical protein
VSQREPSQILIREHNFKFVMGAQTYSFVVEELVAILLTWPDRFRLILHSPDSCELKTFYGSSCHEVVRRAADFVGSGKHPQRTNKTIQSSRNPHRSPSQSLQFQQLQESESD